MKQNTTTRQSPQKSPKPTLKQSAKQSPRQSKKICQGPITIGLDLGDMTSRYRLLNDRGEVVKEAAVGRIRASEFPRTR